MRITKGHGTENDFLLVTDPDADLDLPPELVAALCDRRAGIGADGVIRAARTAALAASVPAAAAALAGDPVPEWFMDYRNGDGSVSEMCGNGVRVLVAHLLRAGLVRLADGEELAVGTRAGTKLVRRDGDLFVADLGPWRVAGGTVTVELPGGPPLPGLAVDVGNPHVVVALPAAAELAAADLVPAPRLDPQPVAGANVEVVVPRPAEGGVGHLLMRVHERGSGETRSCGTGAVASVLAARAWAGADAPAAWWVDVAGGRLRVSVPDGDRRSGARVELAGPAVIVADAEVDLGSLRVRATPQPVG